jgi:hypothetical protein
MVPDVQIAVRVPAEPALLPDDQRVRDLDKQLAAFAHTDVERSAVERAGGRGKLFIGNRAAKQVERQISRAGSIIDRDVPHGDNRLRSIHFDFKLRIERVNHFAVLILDEFATHFERGREFSPLDRKLLIEQGDLLDLFVGASSLVTSSTFFLKYSMMRGRNSSDTLRHQSQLERHLRVAYIERISLNRQWRWRVKDDLAVDHLASQFYFFDGALALKLNYRLQKDRWLNPIVLAGNETFHELVEIFRRQILNRFFNHCRSRLLLIVAPRRAVSIGHNPVSSIKHYQ